MRYFILVALFFFVACSSNSFQKRKYLNLKALPKAALNSSAIDSALTLSTYEPAQSISYSDDLISEHETNLSGNFDSTYRIVSSPHQKQIITQTESEKTKHVTENEIQKFINTETKSNNSDVGSSSLLLLCIACIFIAAAALTAAILLETIWLVAFVYLFGIIAGLLWRRTQVEPSNLAYLTFGDWLSIIKTCFYTTLISAILGLSVAIAAYLLGY